MKYMGSKNRIAKHILPIILKDRKPNQWYVEPFVGGGNIIDKVTGNRLGADSNHFVIDALVMIRDNIDSIPKNNKEFTEQDYSNCREDHSFSCGLVGYAGIAFSFGAKWFGGWSRGKNGKGEQRDYVAEQYRAAVKQNKSLQGCNLLPVSYLDLKIPDNSIVYCDSPYKDTTQYKDKFNHNEYWKWCREQVKKGHDVFISEYEAPEDFICVWSQELNCSVSKDGGHKKAIEKLFVHNSKVDCAT